MRTQENPITVRSFWPLKTKLKDSLLSRIHSRKALVFGHYGKIDSYILYKLIFNTQDMRVSDKRNLVEMAIDELTTGNTRNRMDSSLTLLVIADMFSDSLLNRQSTIHTPTEITSPAYTLLDTIFKTETDPVVLNLASAILFYHTFYQYESLSPSSLKAVPVNYAFDKLILLHNIVKSNNPSFMHIQRNILIHISTVWSFFTEHKNNRELFNLIKNIMLSGMLHQNPDIFITASSAIKYMVENNMFTPEQRQDIEESIQNYPL